MRVSLQGWRVLAIWIGLITLGGASLQRLTGMGFALVAAPGLVLLLGPWQGVLLTNAAACAISSIGLASTWRRVTWSSMLPLVGAAALTIPAGAWVADKLSAQSLLVGVGTVVVVSVLLVLAGVRVHALSGRTGAITAGAASGFMNATTGAGGPPISLYATNAGWSAAKFVPNMQVYSVMANSLSLMVRGAPRLTWFAWSLAGIGVVGGALIGTALAKQITDVRLKGLVMGLALMGGTVLLLKGLTTG
ncbi:TSUP family transporter [Actinomadura xylanilytica]|uniref:TSUP family transporter n=1 Tax=Actinomadura xylanilytica TaxID=887459 RepID=UPI00255B147F|nr:TSUP family transporter [Actinomadura xylanilytica]MDL4776784.1 TSUP family transporter [Actinomadura xylanilytica]